MPNLQVNLTGDPDEDFFDIPEGGEDVLGDIGGEVELESEIEVDVDSEVVELADASMDRAEEFELKMKNFVEDLERLGFSEADIQVFVNKLEQDYQNEELIVFNPYQ